MAFPKLERVYVGGVHRASREISFSSIQVRPQQQQPPVSPPLVESFCAAFRTRMLPRDLEVKGVLGGHFSSTCEPATERSDNPCRFCRNLCACFPHVLNLIGPDEDGTGGRPGGRGDVCISDDDRIKILATRPGAAAFFQSKAMVDYALKILNRSTRSSNFSIGGKRLEVFSFRDDALRFEMP